MQSDRELMQMALDALHKAAEEIYSQNDDDEIGQARRALRARLVQPEPSASVEPVAWRIRCTNPIQDWVLMYRHPKTEEQFSNMEIQPLYTAPQQREWQGLTAAERIDFINGAVGWMDVVCAIEAKLKEKNHG